MRIITGLAFFGNAALWFILCAFGFGASPIIGSAVLLGMIGFFIAWKLSGGMVIAPADYFFQPEWEVFKVKMKWSNSTAIAVTIISSIILVGLFGTE